MDAEMHSIDSRLMLSLVILIKGLLFELFLTILLS